MTMKLFKVALQFLFCALMLGTLTAVASAKPTHALLARLAPLYAKAEAALTAKNYPRAKVIYGQVKTEIAAHDADFQDFRSLIARASIDFRLGLAIGDGKLGDACSLLASSHAWLTRAKVAPAQPGERNDGSGVEMLRGDVENEIKRFGCSPAPTTFLGLTPEPLTVHLLTIFDDADVALVAKDYPKAKTLFEQADNIIVERDEGLNDFGTLLGRAIVELRIARTVGDGKLGDPCLSIAQSRNYSAASVNAPDKIGMDPGVRQDFVAQLALDVDEVAERHRCPARSKSAASITTDKEFVGRYFLSGVTEVGSELRLKPDGSFKWMTAYGSDDQAAQGQWVRDGSKLILRAAADTPEKQAFKTMTLNIVGKDLVAPDFNNGHYVKR